MNKDLNVDYAVIPCAGLGTRFLPITKGVPKEMLNIIDRPTLDFIVKECVDSGIKNIILIVSKGKDDIKRYYSLDKEYEQELLNKGKKQEYNLVHRIATQANFYYITQEELLGLGYAVYLAKDIIKDNNFVVCCGDDITTYKGKPPVYQMIKAFKEVNGGTIVGGQTVPHKEIYKYGCMDVVRRVNNRLYELQGIVEKPSIEKAKSDLASLGKWIFNSSIFEAIKNTKKGRGGEIQLTDAIALLMKEQPVYFYDFLGKRYDCGDKLGYLKAIVDVGLAREDLKDDFLSFLKTKVK